jgi:hypothetical protein
MTQVSINLWALLTVVLGTFLGIFSVDSIDKGERRWRYAIAAVLGFASALCSAVVLLATTTIG